MLGRLAVLSLGLGACEGRGCGDCGCGDCGITSAGIVLGNAGAWTADPAGVTPPSTTLIVICWGVPPCGCVAVTPGTGNPVPALIDIPWGVTACG